MITNECPNVKTMCIVADFGSMKTIDEYQTKIASKLENIDVSVLVINAGVVTPGSFLKLSCDEVEKMITVNVN